MGCPRLPYREKSDAPNFTGLWKKSEGPEKSEDYYPFGLTYNSYQRENATPNRWKFQGQEHIDDLDLGWNSFKWRNQDPSIGRFFNIDPLADKYVYNSPYAFSENKVTNDIELEGLESYPAQQALYKEIQKTENVVMPVVNNTIEGIQSVVGGIGDGIKSAWNAFGDWISANKSTSDPGTQSGRGVEIYDEKGGGRRKQCSETW